MRIELDDIINKFPKRIQNSHKGTYGKILNIAGSQYYIGAALLSSISALKSGAGYLTLCCPDVIYSTIASYTPDITLFPVKNTNGCISKENIDTVIEKSENYDVISIGSGLSRNEDTQFFVIDFLNKINKPCVIDADAINAIADKNYSKLPKMSVITPHSKELSRLLKIPVEKIESSREYYAIMAAKQFQTIVVLKGHNTIVTDGEMIYVNSTGNSGLAKAGTGDVLTGIITGITAQMIPCDLYSASVFGVFIHGLAGDIGVKEMTEYSLLASELINYIPKAVKTLI